MRGVYFGGLFAAFTALSSSAWASPYAFEWGVSTNYAIMPGEVVTVASVLRNTGDSALNFASAFSNDLPSVVGGAIPNLTLSSTGDWKLHDYGLGFPAPGQSPRPHWFDQFASVVLSPGEELAFTFFSFIAPTDQAFGSFSLTHPTSHFGIRFTDDIFGGFQNVTRPGVFSYPDIGPQLRFTLGQTSGNSEMEFFTARVYNNLTGDVISGPPPSFGVPEPGAIFLAMIGVFGVWRLRK